VGGGGERGVWMPCSRFNYGNCFTFTSLCSRFNLLSFYSLLMLTTLYGFLYHYMFSSFSEFLYNFFIFHIQNKLYLSGRTCSYRYCIRQVALYWSTARIHCPPSLYSVSLVQLLSRSLPTGPVMAEVPRM
jgi:hypothetical protein